MRPATVAADASDTGQVVTTTTTRRVVPVDSVSSDPKTPDLWEYLASVKPGEWQKHMIYLYRVEPAPNVPVLKCQQYMTLPNGQQVNVADQQEVEFALLQHYGGKVFRMIVKCGSQWMTQGRIAIDAPPRAILVPVDTPGQPSGGPTLSTTGMGDAAQIANKAIDTFANQDHQAVMIGIGALNAAANVVKSFGTGGSQPQDDLMKQFMMVMLQRMNADPMEQMIKFFALMREMGGVGGGAAAGAPPAMMDKLFSVMFERFLNPTPAGAPVNATAELVRQIPQLGLTAVDGLREFRMAMEAQRDAIKAQHTAPRPGPAPAQVIPPAAPAPPTNGAPSMEFIEKKIIEILSSPNLSAQQAADDALSFVDAIDERIAQQLALMGETGLLEFFQKEPILRPATNNSARLVEFIRAFLKMHADDVAAEQAGKQGQPLPN